MEQQNTIETPIAGVKVSTPQAEVLVHSCTLQALLNSKQAPLQLENGRTISGDIVIPEYQRPYKWNEKNIDKLLNDFVEYNASENSDKPMYYLGSIILHQDGDQLKVIDGQQRITTSLLIKKVTDANFKSGITYSNGLSVNQIKHNLSYLQAIQNGEIFEFIEYTNLLASIDFSRINVTLILTATEDMAYTFFETQNTGGVRLSGSDILKAHHLRALPSAKLVNYQARRWEAIKSDNVERIVELLTKIRFWDNRKWRKYPFYRDNKGIKAVIIDEYTLKTKANTDDISYHYSAVKKENGRVMQMHESQLKQIKQPLTNGNNTLDYINEYVELYEVLFGNKYDHRVPESFNTFYRQVLHGKNGTIFLKELFEIAMVAYVSRFGYYRMYEASLWLYRVIYALRVSSNRNVREDSVFKFVYDNQFIDNIIEVFTPDELFTFLKKFKYNFNTANLERGKSKYQHLKTLKHYFTDIFIQPLEKYKNTPSAFDKQLMSAITAKIKNYIDEH